MNGNSSANLRQERDIFNESVKRGLRQLGLHAAHCAQALERAAEKYGVNVLRETQSASDSGLLKETAETIDMSDGRIGRRVGIWSEHLVAAFCGEAPGHDATMSSYTYGGNLSLQIDRHLQLESPLFAENVETIQRYQGDGATLIKVSFKSALDDCFPVSLDEDRAGQIYKVMIDEIGVGNTAAGDAAPVLAAAETLLINIGTIGHAGFSRAIPIERRAVPNAERRTVIMGLLDQFLQACRYESKANGEALREFTIQFVATCLAAAPISSRRQCIAGLAALAPTDFRNGLIVWRARIKDQYGGEGDQHGKSRNTWLWQSGHAKWILISDILDIVWPPTNGPLGEDSRRFEPAVVEDIINLTHAYAVQMVRPSLEDRVTERVAKPVNGDHIKLMARWRAQIF
jgi:hypothetical protein